MTLRRLDPDESSSGMHTVEAVGRDGRVVARFECDCQWCEIWRAGRPMIEQAIADLDRMVLGEVRPAWLVG